VQCAHRRSPPGLADSVRRPYPAQGFPSVRPILQKPLLRCINQR
jgi:hypothetical protein